MLIKNGLVFTDKCNFEKVDILTENDRISRLIPTGEEADISGGGSAGSGPGDAGEVVDADGCYVLPGLTDIHFHGCNGHDLCEGTAEALEAITGFELSQGITSVCPATMTLPTERITEILQNAAEYAKAAGGPRGSDLVGIHLEGPFINPAKKGAQNGRYIIKPDPELLYRWQETAGGLVKLVTMAPEADGAISCISECRESFRFSLGHTCSSYETALRALQAGADHITHLFNAMPPFGHREPGVIGAAFDEGRCFAELICDGVHVSETAVRAAFRLFGDDRIILISDSMEAAGMPDGEYSLGGQAVTVRGSHALLTDGSLAGSVTTLYGCLFKAVEFGIPLESAVKAATINPCRSIGIDGDYGSIEPGKKAHFLLLNRRDLSIVRVIYGNSANGKTGPVLNIYNK